MDEARSPHDALAETRSSMEELASKILSLKKDPSRPKSDLRELLTQMSLHFVSLRQANRLILLEEDRAKGETEKAKAPVDFTMLQLHNLMYEKSHYIKAIKACKDFRSKYPDIELVPEQEFFACAPEDIRGNVLSKDGGHDLMLKRLNYELFQRKELCKLQEKLEQHKKHLLETIATRKKFLSSLPSHLKSLKKASLPVQQQLGMLHTKKSKQYRAAELLPPPLYIVYTQLLSQKEAFGEKIELEVVGSMKDAQAFAVQQSKKDGGINVNTGHIGMEDETPDDDDDGRRRRKRPKKLSGKDGQENAGSHQSHPLNVVVHIYDDEGSAAPQKLLTLRFEYLVKLNVVCVGVDGAREGSESSILCNLFPDDTGIQLPHQMAKLYAGDALVFDEKMSRPYKWAQHLAGMDFLPEVAPLVASEECSNNEMLKSTAILSGLSLYRHQNRVETLLQRIRSRKKAQLALMEQFNSLEKLKWPPLLHENVPWASQAQICVLEQWCPLVRDLEVSLAVSAVVNEQALEPLDLNVEERTGTLKDGVESATEDGELPSALQVSAALDESKLITPSKSSPSLQHSISFSLIAKSGASSHVKSPRPAKHDDNVELLWDSESDTEQQFPEPEKDSGISGNEFSWENFGVRDYELVLSRRDKDKSLKLHAQVKISMEYPLRPPLFSLRFSEDIPEEVDGKSDVKGGLKWYNELRAMEAEVNLHILKIIPLEQENYILSHQVNCLAMLFDFHFEQMPKCSDTLKSNSIIDLGLCKPVTGMMITRCFRGRDRRRMISWKGTSCYPGYPH